MLHFQLSMRINGLLPINEPRNAGGIVLLTGLLFVVCSFKLLAAENDPPPPAVAPVQDTNSMELLRSNLQLQEQLHGLQLSLEENRKAAETAAAHNAESVAARLQALEQTLAAERVRDQETVRTAVRNSSRMTLLVACTFGVVGFLAMLLMAFQWRTVSRLAEAAAGMPSGHLLGPGNAMATFGGSASHLIEMGGVEQSNTRLLGALDRLEKRIHELEQTGHSPLKELSPSSNHAQVNAVSLPTEPATGTSTEPGAATNGARNTVLLGKGQSLLSLDKTEEALACFDQVLATEPTHTDALIKKAAALERLRKLPEAIECYDRAIAADASLTIAYLYKGGLFNRMERFEEALECYEEALKAQEKRPA